MSDSRTTDTRTTDTRNQDSRSQLREKMAETRENVVDIGHLAKEAVTDKFHDLKERAAEKYSEGKEKLHGLEENLVRSVRQAPMKSVLIAAGVGLLLGAIWGRR